MKWKIEDLGTHCNILFDDGRNNIDSDTVGIGFPKHIAERLVKIHNESKAWRAKPEHLKALKTAIEILATELNKEQFIKGDGYYPVCVACGRTNIEHNMVEPIEHCSWVENETVLEDLREFVKEFEWCDNHEKSSKD